MRLSRFLRRVLTTVLLVAAVVVLFVAAVNASMILSARKRTYVLSDTIPRKQAVLVLGTRVYAKTVQPVLQGRLEIARELYDRKLVRRILVSGDRGSEYYDEANTMRLYLEAAGVPGEDIFMDVAGFSTLDSLYRARDVFRVESIIIATQDFHIPRALFIADRLGIDAIAVPADESSVSDAVAIRNFVREPFARLKAWWDIQAGTKPTVLGEPIPIESDENLPRG